MRATGCVCVIRFGGLIALFLSLFVTPIAAEAVKTAHVEAELLSQVASVRPGEPFFVALRLEMEPGWHTYWLNPGSSGTPTAIQWTLPEGFSAGPILWPTPHRFDLPPLVSYAYEDEVVLPVEITPPADLKPGRTIRLTAKASWLVCKEICLPGKAALELELPVRAEAPSQDARGSTTIEETLRALPRELAAWHILATRTANGYELAIAAPSGHDASWKKGLYFFALDPAAIEPAAPQTLRDEPNGVVLELAAGKYGSAEVTRLAGVLVTDTSCDTGGRVSAMQVDVAVTGTPEATPTASQTPHGLPAMMLFAFLGGLILNLMPCVFPILSIKILGFVRQAGESPSRVRAHGLVFAAGVLVSFWILAAVFLALRAAGEEIGCGFQLQSPSFVVGISFVFLLLALNFLDVFEWGDSLMGVGGDLASRSGYSGSFWNGVLATLVATPCTAPFMGAALGVAVLLPAFAAWLLFTALAVGLAAPYAVLSAAPRWVRMLPKPGPWMETFKQVMAFPLLFAVVWLVGVYSELTDAAGAIRLLAGLMLGGIGAWIFGKWATPEHVTRTRILARVVAVALVVVGAASVGQSNTAVRWENFSETRVAELRAAGRPVFVDFTAAWCVTCQVNKATTLSADSVERAFREQNVATLRADWTRNDPAITRALASLGRNAVPVYALYPAEKEKPPILLPEVLTPGIVIEAVNGLP
jgi:thiol:disulfide interchange protein/DsbC/DsbD-like thiol-disulfide interchange protein